MARATNRQAAGFASMASLCVGDADLRQARPARRGPAAIDRCEGASPCEVASAAFALAARADMKTPVLLPERGSWWNKGDGMTGPRVRHTQKCPEHPEHDMPHDHGGDMTPEQIAEAARAVRAAIKHTRPARPTAKETP